jgi:hypothetical protein
MNHSSRPAPQTLGYSEDVTVEPEHAEVSDWLVSSNHEFIYDSSDYSVSLGKYQGALTHDDL